MTFAPPILVVSPHLDDGALSCGHVLAAHPGSTVATVFAGVPDVPSGPWNRATTGAERARDALALRLDEDRRALDALGAVPLWLDVHEGDYDGRSADERVHEVRTAVAGAIERVRPATVLAPLGLQHVDHGIVNRACTELVGVVDATWFLYEDCPYAPSPAVSARVRRRVLRIPDERRLALHRLRGRVELGRPVAVEGDGGRKLAALEHYASQVPALRTTFPRYAERVTAPERYWPVSPAGAAASTAARQASGSR